MEVIFSALLGNYVKPGRPTNRQTRRKNRRAHREVSLLITWILSELTVKTDGRIYMPELWNT